MFHRDNRYLLSFFGFTASFPALVNNVLICIIETVTGTCILPRFCIRTAGGPMFFEQLAENTSVSTMGC
jgi:hypothetical protein